MAKRTHKVLDLFAGCGGLSKGFARAGFVIHAANEIWHPAAESYRMNHPHTIMIEGDITDTRIKRELIRVAANKVDVIIGGPPCQAYSMAGKRDPSDPRGKLFEDYVDIVREVKPKAFVLENVVGILSMWHDKEDLGKKESGTMQILTDRIEELASLVKRNAADKKKDYRNKIGYLREKRNNFRERVTDLIVRKFGELGYKVEYKVLNAADYGVPQKRKRVIFIGTNTGKKITFPESTHCQDPGNSLFGTKLIRWKTVREAIDDLKDHPENKRLHHVYPKHSLDFVEKIRKTSVGKSVFGSYADAFYRNPPDEPARTVKENHNGVLVHYEKNRVMTPRELARLQDFDDGFVFYGNKSIVLKQIGNAVPVGLARSIAEALQNTID